MTSTPTLALLDFNKPFTVEVDAFGNGIGAMLTQHGKPIAYMSWALGTFKLSWSTYAKEMLVVVAAVQNWRPYLLGQKFFIKTDQRSLKYLMDKKITTPEQQKWVSKPFGYDYEILYKPGKDNLAADALSRQTNGPALEALLTANTLLWDQIRETTKSNPYMQKLEKLAWDHPGCPYIEKNGLKYYKQRIVVPPKSDIVQQLLQAYHNSQMGGHSGVLCTYKRLVQQFFWATMRQSIQEYVSAWDVCQRVKSETLSLVRLLQSLPITYQIWEDFTMDFIKGLPPSQGKNTILVVVDHLSKSTHFLALAHPYTAKVVAEKFVEGIVKLHDMSWSIISDRDSIFIRHFWKEFFKT